MNNIVSISIAVYLLIAFILYYVFFNDYINGREECKDKEIVLRGIVTWLWPICGIQMVLTMLWCPIYYAIRIALDIVEDFTWSFTWMKCFNTVRFTLRKWFSRKKVKMLCVGMEHSEFAGDAPDCKLAISRFFNAVKARCNYAKALYNNDATKDAVLKELKKICEADLAVFVYNGHGGQALGKLFETDGRDEFLGLYDAPLYDNEIWNVISKAKGRVFLIFDCCYAGGMYRDRDSALILPSLMPRDVENPMDILCWASSSEGNVSYTALGVGGIFMKALTSYIDAGFTYNEIWKKITNNEVLARSEIAHMTHLVTIAKSGFNKTKFMS